jgi:hypothetical protein
MSSSRKTASRAKMSSEYRPLPPPPGATSPSIVYIEAALL